MEEERIEQERSGFSSILGTDSFSLEFARHLYDSSSRTDDGKACKDYIKKFIFTTYNGNYYVWDGKRDEFEINTRTMFTDLYLKKFPDPIAKWFIKDNLEIYRLESKLNKPRLSERTINKCPGFLHKRKPYSSYSSKTKEAVQYFIKSFLTASLCSGDEKASKYLLEWLSNMAKGNKNDSALYLRGPEGIGKSTFTDFLIEFVIGSRLTHKAASDVLKKDANAILCGKLLVVFEELPVFGKHEWEGVSSKLKDMITGKTMTFRNLYENAYLAENISNYIINTNVHALQHSQGRRYFILDLSTDFNDKKEFFKSLRKKCLNMEVGEAFFNYLVELDIGDFNAQMEMPITQNKLDAIAERLDIPIQFIKERYILREKGLNISLLKLFEEYKEYCAAKDYNCLVKIQFSACLKNNHINHKCSHGQFKYFYTFEQLNKLAEDNHWIHKFDLENEEEEETSEKDLSPLELENIALKKEIQELKRRLQAAEQSLLIPSYCPPKEESDDQPVKLMDFYISQKDFILPSYDKDKRNKMINKLLSYHSQIEQFKKEMKKGAIKNFKFEDYDINIANLFDK